MTNRNLLIAIMFLGLLTYANSTFGQNADEVHPVRTWTDASGRFQTKAKFLRMNGNAVVLDRDGEQIEVPVSKLTQTDKDYLKNLVAKSAMQNKLRNAQGNKRGNAAVINTNNILPIVSVVVRRGGMSGVSYSPLALAQGVIIHVQDGITYVATYDLDKIENSIAYARLWRQPKNSRNRDLYEGFFADLKDPPSRELLPRKFMRSESMRRELNHINHEIRKRNEMQTFQFIVAYPTKKGTVATVDAEWIGINLKQGVSLFAVKSDQLSALQPTPQVKVSPSSKIELLTMETPTGQPHRTDLKLDQVFYGFDGAAKSFSVSLAGPAKQGRDRDLYGLIMVDGKPTGFCEYDGHVRSSAEMAYLIKPMIVDLEYFYDAEIRSLKALAIIWDPVGQVDSISLSVQIYPRGERNVMKECDLMPVKIEDRELKLFKWEAVMKDLQHPPKDMGACLTTAKVKFKDGTQMVRPVGVLVRGLVRGLE